MARRAEISRARGALRRVRNGLAEALPAIAALEELAELPDNVGRYRLAAGEELDEDDVLDFLRLARQHDNGALEIIVVARSEDLSEVKGHKAEHSGGSDERSDREGAGAAAERRCA